MDIYSIFIDVEGHTKMYEFVPGQTLKDIVHNDFVNTIFVYCGDELEMDFELIPNITIEAQFSLKLLFESMDVSDDDIFNKFDSFTGIEKKAILWRLNTATKLELKAEQWTTLDLFKECHSLTYLIIGCDDMLSNYDGFKYLSKLNKLCICSFNNVEDLMFLSHCSQLVELAVRGCEKLSSFRGLTCQQTLKSLDASMNRSLVTLEGLDKTNIEHLDLHMCNLMSLNGLEESRELLTIIAGNQKLTNCDALLSCTKLRMFNAYNTNIVNADFLKNCDLLEYVSFWEVDTLINIDGLKNCKKLKHLEINQSMVTNLDALKDCSELENLNASQCKKLDNIDGIEKCEKLNEIDIFDTHIDNLDPLRNKKCLEILHLEMCTNIKSIDVLTSCENLTYLNIIYIKNLNIPDLGKCDIVK